jgi:hypothetical protein
MRITSALCGASLVVAFMAAAQAADGSPSGKAIALPKGHAASMVELAHRQTASFPGTCAKMDFATTGEIKFIVPVKPDQHGGVADGAWIDRIRGAGCEAHRHFNIFTIVKNSEVKRVALLPGDTRADPLLQRDAQTGVVQRLTVDLRDCAPEQRQKFHIVDTRVDRIAGPLAEDPQRPPRERRPWKETWVVAVCGKVLELPVHFVPDRTGTTYTFDPAVTKRK